MDTQKRRDKFGRTLEGQFFYSPRAQSKTGEDRDRKTGTV